MSPAEMCFYVFESCCECWFSMSSNMPGDNSRPFLRAEIMFKRFIADFNWTKEFFWLMWFSRLKNHSKLSESRRVRDFSWAQMLNSCSSCQSSLMFLAIFLRFVSVDKLNDFSILETDLSRLQAWADYLALFMLFERFSYALAMRKKILICNWLENCKGKICQWFCLWEIANSNVHNKCFVSFLGKVWINNFGLVLRLNQIPHRNSINFLCLR